MYTKGELMSYEDVAGLFSNRSARWVRDTFVNTKRVDVVKVGNKRFVVRSSLEKFLAAHTLHGFSKYR